MALLILRRFRPEPPLVLRRFGPDGRLAALAAQDPLNPAVMVIGPPGAAGAQGPAGATVRFDFTASATWIATHGLGRIPLVQVYLASGEAVLAEISATTTNITITHAVPQTGFALLI